MNNFTEILEHYPRLRDWYQIGPVQRAELEALVEAVLASKASALTADGKLVQQGDEVWVFDSLSRPVPTSVRPLEAVTNYYLFRQIPVKHSFSSERAARLWQRHNK